MWRLIVVNFFLFLPVIRAEEVVRKANLIVTVDENDRAIPVDKFFYSGSKTEGKKKNTKVTKKRTFINFDLKGLNNNRPVKKATFNAYFFAEKSQPYGNAFLYNVTEKWKGKNVKFEQKAERLILAMLVGKESGFVSFDITPFMKNFTAGKSTTFGFSIRGEERGSRTEKWFYSDKADKKHVPYLSIEYGDKLKEQKVQEVDKAATETAKLPHSLNNHGMAVSLKDNNLEWVAKSEKKIKRYRVFDLTSGKLLTECNAIGADIYSIEVPSKTKVKLVVDRKDGSHEEFKVQ